MKGLLRRRLADTAVVDYEDVDLNQILNDALPFVQKAVIKVDPTAFLLVTRQHIVAGVDLYRRPEGTWSVMKIKARQSNGAYRSLGQPIDDEQLESISLAAAGSPSANQVGNYRFGFFGDFIKIAPVPTASLADGLEWITVQTLQMANDTDVPALHIGLHNAVVLRAQELLMPEQGAKTVEIREQRIDELKDVGDYYRRTVGQEVPFTPLINKGY